MAISMQNQASARTAAPPETHPHAEADWRRRALLALLPRAQRLINALNAAEHEDLLVWGAAALAFSCYLLGYVFDASATSVVLLLGAVLFARRRRFRHRRREIEFSRLAAYRAPGPSTTEEWEAKETAHFVNVACERFWDRYRPKLNAMIREALQPALDSSRPEWIVRL
eukprot:tig00020902_g14989.t1